MGRSNSKLFSYISNISIIIRTMLVEIDTTPEVDPLPPDNNNSAAHYYQVYRCSCSALSNILLHFQILLYFQLILLHFQVLRLFKLISSLYVCRVI